MTRVERPLEWNDRERIELIERLLHRINAERLNIDRRARLINLALDVARAAPEMLDRRWLDLVRLLEFGEPKGMTW